MKSTARAHTNIALIKYWGKRDEQLFLPMNNSISVTLDQFYTTTSVSFDDGLKSDSFTLDGREMDGDELKKISRFLDLIRTAAGKPSYYAYVDSINHVPTAAGFASSASGFAALAAAASQAIGLSYDEPSLSRLARQGSGSACRSIYGGFAEWNKGVLPDGSDSYATQIMNEKAWDISILSVMVEAKQKKVLSREGMKRTVETSAFYNGWLDTIDADLLTAREAIHQKDFEKLGSVLERNALKMHATTLGANPPFMYWTSATFDVMQQVQELRDSGILAYFTIDAGPNVKVACQPKDEELVKAAMQQIPSVREVFVCHPGPGIQYMNLN